MTAMACREASAMKQLLLASAVFVGFAILLGPVAGAIHLPSGVTDIITNLETIF